MAAGVGPTASAAPAELATAALAAARFKDAVEQFKDLLKSERRPDWIEGLALAYAGRAEQLAAKGMMKEALALWRIRAEACQLPVFSGPYVGWLLQNKQLETALGLLPSVDKLPAEAREPALLQLAAALLVAPERLLGGWSEEGRGQRAAARAAVAASALGEAASLETALQAISFRSPYRDLRLLLKALALQGSDATAAAASLARVSAQGPFEPLVQALRVCLMPGDQWLAGLRRLDEAGRSLVLDLKGCPPTQRAMVLDLAAAKEASAATPAALLDLLLRHKRALPEPLARRHCLSLLTHVPQKLDAVRAAFLPPSAAEEAHLMALAAEIKQQPDRAEDHWLRLVKLLGSTAAGQRRAALVLRRLADEHASHGSDGTLCSDAHDWLEQSLQFDPTDRDSHLRLLRDARLRGDLKQARNRLDAARQHFPADTQVLMAAVEIAQAAGAFKKAAGLARQMLETDPLNPQVRTLIGQAHLAHARKLIGTRKLPAAVSELDAAQEWLRSPAERGSVMLLRGLVTEPAAAGDAVLQQAVSDLGGALVGGFQLLLQSKRTLPPLQYAPQPLLRRAGVDITGTPGTTEVLALARALDAVPERDAALTPALAVFTGMLQRAAAHMSCSESEHLLICEALHRHGQASLTERFSTAALERWPERPVFIYLEAAARFADEPWRMPDREWQRLDQVFEAAQDQGDERTASRISQLLGAAEGGGGGGGGDGGSGGGDGRASGPPPSFANFDADQMQTMMREMLELGGVAKFLQLARQQLGAAAFEKLRRDIPGNRKQFAQALVKTLAADAMRDLELPVLPPNTQVPKAAKPAAADPRQLDFFG